MAGGTLKTVVARAPGWCSRLSARLLVPAQVVISGWQDLDPCRGASRLSRGLSEVLPWPLPLPLLAHAFCLINKSFKKNAGATDFPESVSGLGTIATHTAAGAAGAGWPVTGGHQQSQMGQGSGPQPTKPGKACVVPLSRDPELGQPALWGGGWQAGAALSPPSSYVTLEGAVSPWAPGSGTQQGRGKQLQGWEGP